MFTLRRFAGAVITMPIVFGIYAVIYFGLGLVANSYMSIGLFTQNLYAVGFGWVIAVTFAKQFFNLIEKLGE
jgi:hypothetical protein